MEKSNCRVYCAVSECFNSSITHPDITFFRLPANSERRHEWLQLICRSDLENKPNFTAYRICERHFNMEDIRQSANRKLLKKNALPLLMLSSLPSTIPGCIQTEDKQIQTTLSIGVENCTQTETAANESNAETSTSLYPITNESGVKGPILYCCDNCGGTITRFRYKCLTCPDYDLCFQCEMTETHAQHLMLRIPAPDQSINIEKIVTEWQDYYKKAFTDDKTNTDYDNIGNDDESITEPSMNHHSAVNLPDDVKQSIRKEIARVLNNESRRLSKKQQVVSSKRPTQTDKPSGILLRSLLSDTPDTVNEEIDEICDVRSSEPMEIVIIELPGTFQTLEGAGSLMTHTRMDPSGERSESITEIGSHKTMFS